MSAPMGLPDELKTHAAAKWLGLASVDGGVHYALSALPRRKARTGRAGHPAWLYRTEHIRRVRKLMDEAEIGLSAAVRVVAAEIEGRV